VLRHLRHQPVFQPRNFSVLASTSNIQSLQTTSRHDFGSTAIGSSLAANHQILQIGQNILTAQPSRNVIKFSLKKGKRKTVKAVIKRFMRLDWGEWIRTKSGRHKKMWRKSGNNKRRLRQHVFVNSTQAHMLDKMVTNYWKRPKNYVDDIYEPYQTREECRETRRKPFNYQQE